MSKKLYARIFAVKFEDGGVHEESKERASKRLPTRVEDKPTSWPSLDEKHQPCFVETGLLGCTEMPMEMGHCLFTGLRFHTTSYN